MSDFIALVAYAVLAAAYSGHVAILLRKKQYLQAAFGLGVALGYGLLGCHTILLAGGALAMTAY